MPRNKKVVGYADRGYQQKKAIYDCVAQALEDLKYDTTSSGHRWNLPVEQVRGLTARLIGEGYLELTYHHLEVTTVEGLARLEDFGKEFLKETEKELKKRFKKITGKALKLKKVKDDRSFEKASRVQADTSWMLSSNRHGYGARPVGRYLVRDSRVYEFSASLEKTKSLLDG
jgi:hypothetical protein